jgi:hypothetical protein
VAWRFLQDGRSLGRWALGSLHTTEVAPGVFRGASMFDGGTALIRPVAHEAVLTVDYHVGGDVERLVPRIAARVTPGPAVGRSPDCCLVTLTAWRDAAMDDARWARLVACHEVEVLLIQAQLRAGSPA